MSDFDLAAEIDRLTDEMREWVSGLRSHWNTFAELGPDRSTTMANCAIADAQEVVALSAAIQALVAIRTAETGGHRD